MGWTYVLRFADGTESDPFACLSREDARVRLRYWRAQTDPTHPRAVMGGYVRRSGD